MTLTDVMEPMSLWPVFAVGVIGLLFALLGLSTLQLSPSEVPIALAIWLAFLILCIVGAIWSYHAEKKEIMG